MASTIPTQAELMEDLKRAANFADAFLRGVREGDDDIPAGAARQAYHAARKAGFDHSTAGHIEALVSKAAKAERTESRYRLSEYICDVQSGEFCVRVG